MSNCSAKEGPLHCLVNCLNERCDKNEKNKICENIGNEVCHFNVKPYTNYTFTLNCGRQNGIYGKSIVRLFQTKPTGECLSFLRNLFRITDFIK